ncbi:hypothetical protein N7474_005477 [Penicillium riverlandense]|uniref:uncharacterized protein n=1 Tax=Penicillium riverlandense TaxID=1903569 RepID=UPI002547CB23|nr:uncharacterized protein N7474_005477 [Penicillium riverlandense]KAJ5819886.1 hypothetical protein N7474_005477 [Penicillium riverlandense]
MFEVLRHEIERSHKGLTEYVRDDPGAAESYQKQLERLVSLRRVLQSYGTGDRLEVGQEYILKYAGVDAHRQPLAATRDRMGIVTAPDEYVRLTADDIFDTWNPTITAQDVALRGREAMYLTAQGYPGAALKLGKDLWVFEDYRETSYSLLRAAYTALNRPLLLKFLQVAIDYRTDCDIKWGF